MSKRTFEEIRITILGSMTDGRKTVNDISTNTGINWKTVDNHLVYLTGMGLVTKVFDSPYVKIFELSDEAKEKVGKKK